MSKRENKRRTEQEINEASPLSSIIRTTRKANSLTQEQAAARIGVSLNFYRKLEVGDLNVQLGKVLKVLNFFGIEVDFKKL